MHVVAAERQTYVNDVATIPTQVDEVQGERLHVPLYHQPAWIEHVGRGQMLPIRGDNGRALCSVAIEEERSRALPGHRILRVVRFGQGWPVATWKPVVEQLAAFARSDGGVLRLHVEVFLRSQHEDLRAILRANGFVPSPLRSYRHTLTLPIDMPDDVLLAERKSLRKRLREAEKARVQVRVLTDPAFADRIGELQRIAMARSGGSFHIPDWKAVLRLSAEHPELSRVVGLFAEGPQTPADLLGFVWACMHGDHAENRAAGTADMPHALRHVSISYPLLWNTVQWSRDLGATWFDMGGVTLQSCADDPLAGISSFKRGFSETVEDVGDEWVLEPHPWKSRIARAVSTLAHLGRSGGENGR